MRIIGLLAIGLVGLALLAGATWAQAPTGSQRVGTMSELMLSTVYPAANELLLQINRNGPGNEVDWMMVRRSAVKLAESGNGLLMRNSAPAWVEASRAVADVGAAAYRAAEAEDLEALSALSGSLDASCVSCHTQFRARVHPPVE